MYGLGLTEMHHRSFVKNLTWKLMNDNNDGLSRDQVRETFRRALNMWSEVTNLDFTEINGDNADILVRFVTGYHYDPYPFDGQGGTLAHAYFPGAGIGGDTHFDDSEHFTINSYDGKYLSTYDMFCIETSLN